MKNTALLAKVVAERMKRAAKAKTYGELGQMLGGISSQAISSAIARNKIPENWFDIIQEKTGTTREELCRPTTSVTSSLVQNWGNAIDADGCYNVSINQTGAGPPGEGITLTVSEREAHLIELLRMYASSVMWAMIETELQQEEKKYQ